MGTNWGGPRQRAAVPAAAAAAAAAAATVTTSLAGTPDHRVLSEEGLYDQHSSCVREW